MLNIYYLSFPQSFWGKFGEKVSHRNSDYIYDANQFIQYVSDPTKSLSDFYIIDEKTAQVQWSHVEGFVPENFRTNIFLAVFTTAWGRLKLYNLLDMLDDRVLYYDTGEYLEHALTTCFNKKVIHKSFWVIKHK